MSNMLLITAALAISLATSTVALAAMPAGLGQAGEAVRTAQSDTGVEAISWHHNRNGIRLFIGQHRTCRNDRAMFNSDRCMWMHRHHSEPQIFLNLNNRHGNRHFGPNFGFSLGF